MRVLWALPVVVAVAVLAVVTGATAALSTANSTWCNGDSARKLTTAYTAAEGTCAYVFANGLNRPRTVLLGDNGDLLVLEAGNSNRVTLLFDANRNGVIDDGSSERVVLATYSGLNHGLAFDRARTYLYASSASTVVRWPWPPQGGARTANGLGSAEVVLTGMPTAGHGTRTLLFGPAGSDDAAVLYVSIGSDDNVDSDSYRSRVVKCVGLNLAAVPSGGVAYSASVCPPYGDGMRNAVGLTWGPAPPALAGSDARGRNRTALWTVENGIDNLNRADLGGDVHIDNPGEEVNVVLNAAGNAGAAFYGYPYCWSEYSLPAAYAKGRGTQWQHPNFAGTSYTDAWCNNTRNVIKPLYQFPPHNAPLDVVFANFTAGQSAADDTATFALGAFASLHGSWNRNPPSGYAVAHLTFDPATGLPLTHSRVLSARLASPGVSEQWTYRPVGLALQQTQRGARGTNDLTGALGGQDLFVTCDEAGLMLVLTRNGTDAFPPQPNRGSRAVVGVSSASTLALALVAAWLLGATA